MKVMSKIKESCKGRPLATHDHNLFIISWSVSVFMTLELHLKDSSHQTNYPKNEGLMVN